MNININANPNFTDIEDRFEDLDHRCDELDLSSLIPIIAAEAAKIFETEGYGTWPALSPDYAAWKARNFPGQTILRLTDAYFLGATQPGGPHNLILMAANLLTYGVQGLDYPNFHEYGVGRLPARPVFELMADSELFHNRLTHGMGQLITEALRQSGLRR